MAGGAPWVVTGNTRHLTPLDGCPGLRIVEPAAFLAELDLLTVALEIRRRCALHAGHRGSLWDFASRDFSRMLPEPLGCMCLLPVVVQGCG